MMKTITKTTTKRLIATALVLTGTIIVLSAKAEAADYCREYTRDIRIGNTIQQAFGTACLQPDGSWMVVNERQPHAAVVQAAPIVQERVVYVEKPRYVSYRKPVVAPLPLKVVATKKRYDRFDDRHYGLRFR